MPQRDLPDRAEASFFSDARDSIKDAMNSIKKARDSMKESIKEAGDSMKEIRDGIAGIARFFETLTDVVSTVTSLTGFRVFVLLLAVMLVSSIFTFLGLPKGKTVFFLSLISVDALWIIWQRSFEPLSMGFFWVMIKANAILLAPVLVISLSARYLLPVFSRLARFLGGLLRRILPSAKTISSEEIVNVLDRFQRQRDALEKSIIRDIVYMPKKGGMISASSKRLAAELSRTLEWIENSGKK